ncbi:MAG TPA: SGNH/GDSL hydrolase family protein [bacterium]|nr:SGNH/GDSL hydrolase family protein [bacterium]
MSRTPAGRRIFFAAVITLAALAGLELGLRLIDFTCQRSLSYMQFNFPRPNELYQVFEPDPELLWRMRPGFNFGEGFEPLNHEGFRGPEFKAQKAAGALRIACLGDSVTFGRPDAAYPALLSEELTKELGRPVEAINFGVPGYSSWQGRKLLPRVLDQYHPDVVIIMFGWNDHWLAKGFADQDQIVGDSDAAGLLAPLRALRTYQLLNKIVARVRAAVSLPPLTMRVAPDDYHANLVKMIGECRAAHVLPLIALAPSAIVAGKAPEFMTALEFIRAPADLQRFHNQYNDIARGAARETGAPLIDLDLLFSDWPAKDLFEDPDQDVIHPNREGYLLVAGALAKAVEEQIAAK